MRPLPPPPVAPAARRGFTLLELLVAITVLSIVSLIAWRGLDSLVHTRDRLQPEADQVRDLLVAFGQIERDLAQVVKPAFVPLTAAPLRVRGGGSVGFDLLRLAPYTPGVASAVQWVAYEIRDGSLRRQVSAPLDTLGDVPTATLSTTILLPDVRSLQLRVWQPGRGWLPPEAAAPANPLAPPAGLEIVVERSDGRQYRRVLLVG